MLYIRKVYQNPPPCSRLSQRFLGQPVEDDGNWLAIRFGPLPLFRRTVRYAAIEGVEVSGHSSSTAGGFTTASGVVGSGTHVDGIAWSCISRKACCGLARMTPPISPGF